ncbi:MAG: hypothetical protein KF699_13935 [Phycisphaeraceae bacterium]|nr:hypothetical protein [Phycisphaeraceae bacterium]
MAKKQPEYPTKDTLIELALELCGIADEFAARKRYTEKHFELLLYYILKGRGYPRIKRQKKAQLPAAATAKKPNQIDFEIGVTNRVSIEFAVRHLVFNKKTKRYTASGHRPISNGSELRKLTHETVAKVRYLLITDVSGKAPVDAADLKTEYKAFTAAGGFVRVRPVTVIYVHSKAPPLVIKC